MISFSKLNMGAGVPSQTAFVSNKALSDANILTIVDKFSDQPEELKRQLKKEFARSNELVYKLADRVKWLERTASTAGMIGQTADFPNKK